MRRQGVADNPVLVGAAAILVILVLVLLSYNASSGLPFVPTYNITADIPGGAALVKGNDVRIGGARVGLITSITPEYDKSKNDYYAQIAMKLDKNIGPIPANSTIEVRPKSTIGLKYVQLTLGNAQKTIPNGGNLPLSQAVVATEFEDLLDTFDKRVREGNARSLQEFGDAFAGRGQDLNTAFGDLGPLFENLEPVAKTVAAPATNLAGFIDALAQAAHDTAAAGDAAGDVWVNADITFGAFAAASKGIEDSLQESPSTLTVLTNNFPAQRAYFAQLTDTVERFQPGAPYLPEVASNLASITRNGPRSFNHLYRTAPKFDQTLTQLGAFAANEQVRLGLNGLRNFLDTINQPLTYITPSQTVCNYWGLLARNLASTVSSRDGGISWLRFAAISGFPNESPRQNAEVGPGNGLPNFSNGKTGSNFSGDIFHSNPYPSTGQNNVCAAGNEITRGANNPGQTPLSTQVTVGNPAGIKTGKTTEDTAPEGTYNIRTK